MVNYCFTTITNELSVTDVALLSVPQSWIAGRPFFMSLLGCLENTTSPPPPNKTTTVEAWVVSRRRFLCGLSPDMGQERTFIITAKVEWGILMNVKNSAFGTQKQSRNSWQSEAKITLKSAGLKWGNIRGANN